nr:unnamed protein product [Naegleria fowleri]
MSIDDSYGTADETNHNETVGIAPIHHHQHQHINYIDAPMKRKKKSSEAHTYGSFVAYCFCVNYILGVGVLGVPNGFQQGGVLIGPIFLFIVTIFAALVLNWILETLCRANAFMKVQEKQKLEEKSSLLHHDNASMGTSSAAVDGNGTVVATATSDTENILSTVAGTQYSPFVQERVVIEDHTTTSELFEFPQRRYEMNELSRLFLGRIGKVIYEIALCCYLYGSLWSYSTVFAESMASHVPLPINGWFTCNVYSDNSSTCDALYKIYVGLYALVVVPMTCLNLTEQKPVQIILTIFRYVALALMIGVAFISMFLDPYSRYPSNPHTAMERHPPYVSETYLARGQGIYILLPICIYSQILHHSVPGLCEPVRNKKHLPAIFTSTFITTYLFYTLLGIVLAVYYGDNILGTCSLNFGYYRGGKPFGMSTPIWAELIVYVIILFPAIDVLSAFPLNAITLGNNIHAAFFTGTKWMDSRKVQVVFRLIAAVPPIIGALFVSNLEFSK